jgi:hypothetical protein
MGDILEQYAIDAGEIEEVTPFEDEVGLTEAVDYNEFDKVSESVVSIGNVVESLESLNARFVDTIGDAEWSVEARRQYESGVNAIFSANGFTLSKSTLDYSAESNGPTLVQRGRDLLVRLWDAFKEGLGKLVDIVINLINSWGKTRATVMRMAVTLRERVKANPPTSYQSNMQGSPSWSSYLRQDGVTLSAQRALKVTGDLIKTLGTDWVDVFDKLGREIAYSVDHGEIVDQAWLQNHRVFFPKGTSPWPGGYDITLSDGATALEQSIVVTRTPVLVDRPPLLSASDIIVVANALDDVADSMGDVELALRRGVAELKSLRKRINSKTAMVGPQVLSKAVRQIAAGPRTLLPITGSICQNAFRHANASLQH